MGSEVFGNLQLPLNSQNLASHRLTVNEDYYILFQVSSVSIKCKNFIKPSEVTEILSMPSYSHKDYQRTVHWLLSQTHHRPKVAIICGSGLGMLADSLQCQESFKYSDIPGFPQSTGEVWSSKNEQFSK